MRPSPRPLDGPTVAVDDAWPAAVALRLRRLRDDAAGVRVLDPAADDDGLLAALRAALAVVEREAPEGLRLLPAAARAHLAGLSPRDGELAALADLVTLAQPADLVVLRRAGPGRLTAELLAVAFPSGWPPRLRAGCDLAALHAPVADGERLRRASPGLSEALLTKGPFTFRVWGVQRDDRLDHDPSAAGGLPAADPAGAWWVRVERQTTVPLPALSRALFFIRPSLLPVAGLSRQRRDLLGAAVRSMSPDSLQYKGLGGCLRDDLLAAIDR